MVREDNARHGVRRKARWVATALVAAGTFLALTVPPLIAAVGEPDSVEQPRLPSTIAKYSWWTGPLSHSPIDAASLLYHNGFDVELGDFGQLVMLGADGASYRRLDLAESLSTPQDQGDPAPSALSPDGTFAVVGSNGATGEVHVVALRDGGSTTIRVGAGRTATPLAIGADGRTALLATADGEHDPYAMPSGLSGLASLDLTSGELREYPGLEGVQSAAPSPDGSVIAVELRGRGIVLIDADDGRELSRLDLRRSATIDGDSWSPDGSKLAVAMNSRLAIVDADEPSNPRVLKLDKVDYGYVAGWRDESTVLFHVHGYKGLDLYDNESFLAWVDTTSGELERIAFYRPNWTGAAMGTPDAARDLIPRWEIADDLPVDRGVPPLMLVVLASLGTGLVAWIVLCAAFPLRRRTGPPRSPVRELVGTR